MHSNGILMFDAPLDARCVHPLSLCLKERAAPPGQFIVDVLKSLVVIIKFHIVQLIRYQSI